MDNNPTFAALDIGTNSFHLIVASATPQGNLEILDSEREVIRLSEGSLGVTKIIQPESIERAIKTLNRFNIIAESYNVELLVTATSAVRESSNKDEFIKIISERTGVKIEVISGLEEARLIYHGIRKAIPILNKKCLAIDIGGGSTEFILGRNEKIEFSDSIKIGAVRLSQKFSPDYILTEQRVEETRKWVEGEISPIAPRLADSNVEVFVGTSGTIMNVGLMIQAKGKIFKIENQILNNFEFSSEELFEIEKMVLSKKSPEERKDIPGLEEKRADIIPTGIIILSTIFRMLKIKKMIISGYALREGIILDSMEKAGIS